MRIAYTCRSGGRAQICLMTPTGGSKTNVTAALGLGGDVSEPSWSPDSRRLAFSAHRPTLGATRVYTMPRAGGTLRDVTPLDGEGRRNGYNAAYSPDGTRIAMEQNCVEAPCGGIRTVRTDGTAPVWVAASEDYMSLDAGAWGRRP
jgi:dipeptidyl aminopeptidase/acylaminoacyl peptidase